MVKLISVRPHTYGGKTIEADQEYEVEEQYVETLVRLGRARRADADSTKVEPMKNAKSDQDKPTPPGHENDKPGRGHDDDKPGKGPKPKPTPKGGTYKTRRLKAGDD